MRKELPMQKPAETRYPINHLLQKRWSPRAFANDAVDHADLLSLFEAARWTPSSGNQQPWSFIVTTRHDPQAIKVSSISLPAEIRYGQSMLRCSCWA
jgi:hypothetical protein